MGVSAAESTLYPGAPAKSQPSLVPGLGLLPMAALTLTRYRVEERANLVGWGRFAGFRFVGRGAEEVS